jgi:hypothetical protein
VVLNEKDIYVLKNKETVQLHLQPGNNKINISNGYHYIAPLQVNADEVHQGYQVDTYLDNFRMGYLAFITVALFVTSWLMKSTLLQIAANLPILVICAYILIDKKSFLLLHPLHYTPLSCRG